MYDGHLHTCTDNRDKSLAPLKDNILSSLE